MTTNSTEFVIPFVDPPADSTTSTTQLDKLWRRRPFTEGEDVLLEDQDGLMYFGIIVEVDHDIGQCLVRFGDCTEKWSPFFDLRRLGGEEESNAQGGEVLGHDGEEDKEVNSSNFCETEESESLIDFEDDLPLKKLKKRKRRLKKLRIVIQPVKREIPEHVLQARKELPYNFDQLNWDENHQRNDLDRYCYCGEAGDWYKKMFQCNDCLQWFHQECLRKSTPPILFGDRFFEFQCGLCTGKVEESVKRLDMTWVEALQLVLFHLTVVNSKKFHDLETSVVPFFKRKWKSLQGPGSLLKSSRIETQFFIHLLLRNKTRFKCGSEIKKRSTFWGLRKVIPPAVPPKYGLASGQDCVPPTSIINYQCKLETKTQRMKKQQQNSSSQATSPKSRHRPASKMVPPISIPLNVPLDKKPKKRGRPPRFKKRTDSLENGSPQGGEISDCDTSSRGTLDSFIPPPKDFEGFNNPFRNLGLCPFQPSALNNEGLIMPALYQGVRKREHRQSNKSTGLLMIQDPSVGVPKACPNMSNAEDDNKKPGKLLSDLKYSLHSYFGAETRIAKGERFNVMARRLTLDGDIQYLLEWEQPNPMSPPIIETSNPNLLISPTKSDVESNNGSLDKIPSKIVFEKK